MRHDPKQNARAWEIFAGLVIARYGPKPTIHEMNAMQGAELMETAKFARRAAAEFERAESGETPNTEDPPTRPLLDYQKDFEKEADTPEAP